MNFVKRILVVVTIFMVFLSHATGKQYLLKPISNNEKIKLLNLIKAPSVSLNVSVSLSTRESFVEKKEKPISLRQLLKKAQTDPDDKELLIKIGSIYLKKKMQKKAMQFFSKAIILYTKVLRKDKTNSEAIFQVGKILEKTGEIKRAFQLYVRALKLNKKNPRIWEKLADVFLNYKNDLNRSLYCLLNAIKYDPNNAELYSTMQFMLYVKFLSLPKQKLIKLIKSNQLDSKVNLKAIKKAVELTKEQTVKYVIQYRFFQLHKIFIKLMIQGEWFANLSKNTEKLSNKDLSTLRKIETLLQSKKAENAMKQKHLFKIRGLFFLIKGNKKRSLYWFEKAHIADLTDKAGYNNLALFYLKLTPDKKRFSLLMKKKREMAPSPTDHLLLGKFYFKEKKYKKAAAEYKKAILKMPRIINGFLGSAAAMLKLKKTEESRQMINNALRLSGENKHLASLWSGIFFMIENKGEKAFSQFVHVLTVSKNDKQCIKILDTYFQPNLRFKAQSMARKNIKTQ